MDSPENPIDEEEHVHQVYELIADHFSATRYKVRCNISSRIAT